MLQVIMATSVQLQHPAGKKAVRMDRSKYERLKTAIVDHLATTGGSTHPEMLQAMTAHFTRSSSKFEGSIPWHLEWVKLDLEARKIIERAATKTGTEYKLVK